MATRAGIDAAITSKLDDDHIFINVAVKMEFDSGDLLIWSGIGDLTLGGETYIGAGSLLAFSDIEETQELKSSGLQLSLSGMDSTILTYALTENYQNRPITTFLCLTEKGSNALTGSMLTFKGRMTSMTITDDPSGSTIKLDAENKLIDLQRPSNLRYTNASQQYIDSDDTSFRYVQQMEDLQVSWGKTGVDNLANPNDYQTNF